jgi:hypothetical protein
MIGGLLAMLMAPPAKGQHPLPQLHKPLSERVALSDAVALGSVTKIDPGRLHVQRVEPLLGEVPETFEVKRSPRGPERYEVGDLDVFFLRGSRSPYVLAEEARERLRFVDPAAVRRFAAAVGALVDAGGDRSTLLALHVAWLGSPDDPLRRLAINAFLLPEPPFGPLPPATARELARAAGDPDRELEERRASTIVALTHAEGLAELVGQVPGPARAADAGITERVLRVAAVQHPQGAAAALRRTLAHPDPEIRRVGLRVLGRWSPLAVPRETVARIAESDPDAETRHEAERTLQKLYDSL